MKVINRIAFATAAALTLTAAAAAQSYGDALAISLNGQVPTPRNRSIKFDLDANGTSESIKFPKLGGGIFAVDLGGDGMIANGNEVLGPTSGNPYREMAAFDSNGDLWIDYRDADWNKLCIWTKDSNFNDVVLSMSQAG